MKKYLLFLIGFFFYALSLGQSSGFEHPDTNGTAEQVTEGNDALEPSLINQENEQPLPFYFPEDSMRKIRAQKDYQYMKRLDSLLRNLKFDLQQTPEKKSTSIFDLSLVKILLWGLALFAVLYMLYQLFAGRQSLFSANKQLDTTTPEEDKPEKGLSLLILAQQAADRGEYRLAIRYQYVYLLRLLAEKQMIVLLPQKTNAQYLSEVKQRPFSEAFAKLTLQYEYVWYGGFTLTREQFDLIASGFRKFISTWL